MVSYLDSPDAGSSARCMNIAGTEIYLQQQLMADFWILRDPTGSDATSQCKTG